MTERGKHLLAEVLELEENDRAWLAREVVASLDGNESARDVDSAWTAEIRKRLEDVKSGTAALEDWSQTRNRLIKPRS